MTLNAEDRNDDFPDDALKCSSIGSEVQKQMELDQKKQTFKELAKVVVNS